MQQFVWQDDPHVDYVHQRTGKTYTVYEPGYQDALTLQAIRRGETEGVPDGPESWRLILGDAFDEMAADNVGETFFARVALSAYAYFVIGDHDAAERIFAGSSPEAPAAPEAANQQPEKPTRSRRTAGAGTTRTPASTSGTRTPRKR